MDILKRRFRNVEREFYIYSQAEADEAGIEYVPWQEAKKGDWVLSDDGYVGECLDIQGPYTNYQDSKKIFMTFSFGKLWQQKGSELSYLKRKATGAFYTTSDTHWAVREISRRRAKNLIDAYVAMFMVGRIDWDRLGRIYRSDQKNPAMAAKFIVRQEVFRKMISERLQKEFSEKGITEGDVIDRYLAIYKKANREKNPDLRVMKSVTDEFRDMLDMKPKQLPAGRGYPPGEEVDADYEEIQADIDRAQIELGQKKIEAGETKEE